MLVQKLLTVYLLIISGKMSSFTICNVSGRLQLVLVLHRLCRWNLYVWISPTQILFHISGTYLYCGYTSCKKSRMSGWKPYLTFYSLKHTHCLVVFSHSYFRLYINEVCQKHFSFFLKIKRLLCRKVTLNCWYLIL